MVPGIGKFSPADPESNTLKPQEKVPLSRDTEALLREKEMKKEKESLTGGSNSLIRRLQLMVIAEMVRKLHQDMNATQRKLRSLAPSIEETRIIQVGNMLASGRCPMPSRLSELVTGIDFGHLQLTLQTVAPPEPGVSRTIGKVNRIGVADLLLGKQQLIGYEPADVAHIENMLKGESEDRVYTCTDRAEATTILETETIQNDTHEFSSAARFEMGQESQKQIKEDFEIKGSAQLTARYGPAVEILC
jgi:hypothetical protein